MRGTLRVIGLIAAAGSTMLLASACASSSPRGGEQADGKAVQPARSDVIQGEQVVLRLVRYDELGASDKPQYTHGGTTITLPPRPESPWRSVAAQEDAGGQPRFIGELAGGAIGTIVGLVVDTIERSIREEAAKHERQYRQHAYATDFWEDFDTPRYAGIEISRYAKGFGDNDDRGKQNPAARVFIAFEYSPSDPRIVLMKPALVEVKAAKAKVSPSGGTRRMDLRVDVVMVGAHIDDKGAFQQGALAQAAFVLGALNLDEPQLLTASLEQNKWTGSLKDHSAGYFRAPMVSSDRVKEVLAQINRGKMDLDNAENALAAAKTKNNDNSAEFDRLTNNRDILSQRVERYSDFVTSSKWRSGGAFAVTVMVTETDRSKVKDYLIEVADVVGAQRATIQDAARKAAK